MILHLRCCYETQSFFFPSFSNHLKFLSLPVISVKTRSAARGVPELTSGATRCSLRGQNIEISPKRRRAMTFSAPGVSASVTCGFRRILQRGRRPRRRGGTGGKAAARVIWGINLVVGGGWGGWGQNMDHYKSKPCRFRVSCYSCCHRLITWAPLINSGYFTRQQPIKTPAVLRYYAPACNWQGQTIFLWHDTSGALPARVYAPA